jgi:hypothetical protein
MPLSRRLLRCFDAGEHVQAVGEEGLTHLSQALPARRTMYQLGTEPALQVLNVVRDHGGG